LETKIQFQFMQPLKQIKAWYAFLFRWMKCNEKIIV
jgi:hypothetical protein